MNSLVMERPDQATENWLTLCEKSDLIFQAGVCALLDSGEQIAIFQVNENEVYGISNYCPFGNANVLYRGILGAASNGDVYVASPLYKQRFSLTTGQCLDDEQVQLKVYPCKIIDNQVQILQS